MSVDHSYNSQVILIPCPGVCSVVYSHKIYRSDLAEQGVIHGHMGIWLRELSVDSGIYVCSLIAALVINALAECAYQKPL